MKDEQQTPIDAGHMSIYDDANQNGMYGDSFTINGDGLESLMDNYTYMMLIHLGRDLSLEKFISICRQDHINIPDQELRYHWEFACDLYDDNEESGWNDEAYPNRKSKRDSLFNITLSTMQRHMSDKNAADPDHIAQAVVDHFSMSISDQKCQEVYDAVHNLASVLVKDIGEYM